MAQSLLHARLLYNSAVWHDLSEPLLRTISHAYLSPISQATDTSFSHDAPRVEDSVVLKKAAIPSAHQLIVIHRLKLLIRMLAKGPAIWRRLFLLNVGMKGSWSSAVLGNLSTFWMYSTPHSQFYAGPVREAPGVAGCPRSVSERMEGLLDQSCSL